MSGQLYLDFDNTERGREEIIKAFEAFIDEPPEERMHSYDRDTSGEVAPIDHMLADLINRYFLIDPNREEVPELELGEYREEVGDLFVRVLKRAQKRPSMYDHATRIAHLISTEYGYEKLGRTLLQGVSKVRQNT